MDVLSCHSQPPWRRGGARRSGDLSNLAFFFGKERLVVVVRLWFVRL